MTSLLSALSAGFLLAIAVMIAMMKQPVNIVSLYGCGLLFYGFPLCFRVTSPFSTNGVFPIVEIEDVVFISYFLAFAVFFLACRVRVPRPVATRPISFAFAGSCFIGYFASLLLFLTTTGIENLLIIDKTERLAQMTSWHVAMSIYATLLAVICGQQKVSGWRRILWLAPASFIMVQMFLQTRVTIILGAISWGLARFSRHNGKMSRMTKLKIGVMVFVAAMVFFPFKGIWYSIAFGEFSFQRMPEYYIEAIKDFEPWDILSNFNEVVRARLVVPDGYFKNILLCQIPFGRSLFEIPQVTFNEQIQTRLFPNVKWGMGSTAFGELYSQGGLMAELIFLLGVFLLLIIPGPREPHFRLLHTSLSPYFFWYFHRNDWHYAFAMAKFFLIIWGFTFLLTFLMKKAFATLEDVISVISIAPRANNL
ncbi:MAG TPA: hypothetical protein PLP29_11770 [Candidatus Ozemobacteraceae bacterium]|nr:hypothetical protein [Candidatus Ozemobacteraceae bacterium]